MTLPSPTRIARALGVASVTASLILAAVIWFPVVSGDTEGPTFDQRDWIAFHRTGVRLAEGRSAEIYLGDMEDRSRPEFTDGLFFLYPPPVAWLTRPLGNLEPRDAYAICIAVVAAGALAVFLSLLAVTPARPAHRVLAFVALAASLPWNSAIVLGHLGTLLVVPLAGGLAALGAGRSGLSGAALGLLLVKPNWGVPLLALLVIGRQWRMVRGFLATAAFLVAVSLPLGPELWGDWFRTMGSYRDLMATDIAVYKQSTLLAAVMAWTDASGTDPLVLAIWLPAGLLAGAWVARLWFSLGRDRPEEIPRLLGVTMLALLVMNPYAFYYDQLMILPAAMTLWLAPGAYRHRHARRGALGATLLAYWGGYAQLLQWSGPGASFVGILLAVWLVVELWELGGLIPRRDGPAPAPGSMPA